jgi:hypothetical protein
MINNFNNWLSKNGHSQYLEKIESEKCKSFKKYSQNWYEIRLMMVDTNGSKNIRIN